MYENPTEYDKRDWDVDRMGAFLMGNDIAMISSRDSLDELFRLESEALTDAIVRQTMTVSAEAIEQILLDFWAGLHSK